ncbi:acyltransferase family protein [Pedobacter vanadiisoli]|uniref:Acyltransferase family protein n=1 Tax=Pedobacter vanadiisoli TaxID=1761975 RepID=A0ABW5MM82_9SPHI
MKRVQWLDSLRGIAAVLVMIMHIWEIIVLKYADQYNPFFKEITNFLVIDFFNFGKIGVAVFFLVSGYVIPYSLKGKDLKHFAVSRLFRLYPAYWLSIIIFISIMGLPPIIQLIFNFTMFQKFFGFEDLIGVFWTLQIELVFYFICALLFYFKKLDDSNFLFKATVLLLFATLILSFFRFYYEIKLPVALPLGLSIMFIGLLIRDIHDGVERVKKKLDYKIIIYFAIFLLPICILAYNKDYGFHETWYKYFLSYMLAVIIFFLFLFKGWTNRFTQFFGKISYSLYLLHPITALIITPMIINKYPILSSPLWFTIIGIVLSVIIATLCYYFVEERFVKIGKRLINKYR